MKASLFTCVGSALIGGLTLLWGAPEAQAAGESRSATAVASPASVAQLNEEGAAFYAARDYRHAIEKFIQAYAVDSDPNLLFNIARCYEELGETDAAIEKYETFLKTPGADARGRQRAQQSLTSLRQMRDAAKKGDSAKAAEPAPEKSLDASAVPAAPAAPEHASSNVLPWVLLGGAITSAAVGTTFYLLGVSDHHEVTNSPGYGDPTAVASMTQKQAEDLVHSGNTKKLIGGIGLGLGGALAATYVIVMVSSGHHNGTEQPSLALGLSPGNLTLAGRF
jgi:hypothetical protein